MTQRLEKPIPPADGECCESGCTHCVWEVYTEALRQWREQEEAATLGLEAGSPESVNSKSS